jgi:CelD/BcsL family acetyltransferase involved in cellulose biosynthesis
MLSPAISSRPSSRVLSASNLQSSIVPKVTFIQSAREMGTVRPLWESLCRDGQYTVFQDFLWNLLALSSFSTREQPCVVCVQSSYGAAIVPAVLRRGQNSMRLLGEELFDYRTFLHRGDDELLRAALAELAPLTAPLEIVAARESDCRPVFSEMNLERFSASPIVHHSDINADQFAAAHTRLSRNLRRLNRLGFEMKLHQGSNSRLVRSIYRRKAEQEAGSLFQDHLRVDFLVNAAAVRPEVFEVFTLENGSHLAAALVTFRDQNFRRFYTGWFDPGLEKHSPGMVLIHEVTRQSLASGLDCDYMTGEQPYKMRLATRVELLYRVCATTRQLAAMSRCYQRLSA